MDQSVYGQSKIVLKKIKCSGTASTSAPATTTPTLSKPLIPPLPPQVTGWHLSSDLCMCVWVNGSNGSGTSEDLFWKLDALQTFIRDLHWPEEEFAKHLESRIKLMSSNMIENCVKRCVFVWLCGRWWHKSSKMQRVCFLHNEHLQHIFILECIIFNLHCSTRMAFESKLAKSSKSTDFRISPTLCTMFNVMVDAKDQSAKLCAMEMGQEVKTSSGAMIACWTMRLCAFNLLTWILLLEILLLSTETVPLPDRRADWGECEGHDSASGCKGAASYQLTLITIVEKNLTWLF